MRTLTATYVCLTALIVIFTCLYAIEGPAVFLKFGVRTAMVLTVLLGQKYFREQKIMAVAFVCTLASDYFFSIMRVTDIDYPNRELYGMLGFLLSYVFLIAAFQRNYKFGKRELLVLLPFVTVFATVLILLGDYAQGVMLWAAIVLGIVLCYTGMTMVSSLYRGYFNRSAAWCIAVAGCVLFASDMVVAFSIFHPDFKGFVLWKENFIWITYMLGWLLLTYVALSENLTAGPQKAGKKKRKKVK